MSVLFRVDHVGGQYQPRPTCAMTGAGNPVSCADYVTATVTVVSRSREESRYIHAGVSVAKRQEV